MKKNMNKDREKIEGLIAGKMDHIEKLNKFIEETSDKLDGVKKDLDEAVLGDDPNKVSSLTVKRDMLTAKLNRAQEDLKKMNTRQSIPEDTYRGIMDDLQNAQIEVYQEYRRNLSEYYKDLCDLINNSRAALLEIDGMIRTVNQELYVRMDNSGYPMFDDSRVIGAEGDRIKDTMYHAIKDTYGTI